jgi:hypothetical protein
MFDVLSGATGMDLRITADDRAAMIAYMKLL